MSQSRLWFRESIISATAVIIFAMKKCWTHPFRWTATKIAAVELGYAIYAAGVLNNGQADIKEIMTFMEASFQIDLGDYYRTYITMKDRKKDRTSFLNSLIKSLLKKMDEDDNL